MSLIIFLVKYYVLFGLGLFAYGMIMKNRVFNNVEIICIVSQCATKMHVGYNMAYTIVLLLGCSVWPLILRNPFSKKSD